MDFWTGFWLWFLFLGLLLFLGLAIVVTIGGFFDIRALFHTIHSRQNPPDDASHE